MACMPNSALFSVCPDVRRSSIPGGMSFYSSNPPPRTPDNVLYQSCMNGYVRKGPLTRTCQKDGTWDGSDDFTCLKGKCSRVILNTAGGVHCVAIVQQLCSN